MASRNESFRADDETHRTLSDLGYSEEQIGATAGQLPTEMQTEEKLRLSLRALSAEHSVGVQQRAEAAAPGYNPKVFEKQEQPPTGEDKEAYERGRRDERYLKRNDPNYVKPPRQPRARAVRQPPPPAVRALRLMKKSSAMYRKMGGGRR